MTHQFVPHQQIAMSYFHFVGRDVSFKVFPHLGGSLQEWSLNDTEIIPRFDLTETAKEHHLLYATQAVLFPFPNRLEQGKFTHENTEYQLPITEPARENAIHGFLKNCKFEVVQVSNNELVLHYNHTGNEDFPFAFQFSMNYSFSEDGFSLCYTVKNNGDTSFPFGIGWHPYFQTGSMDKAYISFQSTQTYCTNEAMIPTRIEPFAKGKILLKNAQLDTCFDLVHNEITLATSRYKLNLKAPQADYLQLFIPENRSSIAIEPMTCIPNAFNNDMGKKILEPNQSYTFTAQITASICP